MRYTPRMTQRTFAVIGGAGYLGRNLVRALVERGEKVQVLDLRVPDESRRVEGVTYRAGDLRDAGVVNAAIAGADAVFHAASKICALTIARPQVRDEMWAINVGGTQNVLDACRTHGVSKLIYTSSVNVVPVPTDGGDETREYVHRLADLYSTTKAEAERRVLAADGAYGLHTCALRPGGIYGPGEEQHFPRLVRELKAGKLIMNLGSPDIRADNIYIDDLVAAHLAAADALGEAGKANGKAYFITDGEPKHYLEFFRPIIEALGHRFPRLYLPGRILMGLAWVSEAVHVIGGPAPFTTAMEASKIVKQNWFRIDAASRDLGWTPQVGHDEGMRRSLPYVRELYSAAG